MNRITVLVTAILATSLFAGTACAAPEKADDMTKATELMVQHHKGMVRTAPEVAKVGEQAPPFTLDAVVDKDFKKVSLGDYRGKWVVLFFYPADFTFVCPTEITGFNKAMDRFTELNAQLLGASVDSKYSHLAWIKRGDLGDLKYPLLADNKKEATARYGILDEKEGVALRGLFIIDPNGVLQYQVVNNLSVGRSVDETLRVLEALQTGELCPLGWKPGEKTIK
ncbi:thioredoxin peroxidase [Geobacter hydrogenophilus]|uniref:Alkyl hydroperoxide reductase C n=2 Tax=Geobacter hydrogenophilus TaxID=40983 RepID=A0A9W6G413_9BACT|nr:peroxiredoxin [Geobacter hydrogenophilus]GLI40046.1 thioredoxin peroxidase [Geobacter hydrogenophilus]